MCARRRGGAGACLFRVRGERRSWGGCPELPRALGVLLGQTRRAARPHPAAGEGRKYSARRAAAVRRGRAAPWHVRGPRALGRSRAGRRPAACNIPVGCRSGGALHVLMRAPSRAGRRLHAGEEIMLAPKDQLKTPPAYPPNGYRRIGQRVYDAMQVSRGENRPGTVAAGRQAGMHRPAQALAAHAACTTPALAPAPPALRVHRRHGWRAAAAGSPSGVQVWSSMDLDIRKTSSGTIVVGAACPAERVPFAGRRAPAAPPLAPAPEPASRPACRARPSALPPLT